jgi:hypothetical protein
VLRGTEKKFMDILIDGGSNFKKLSPSENGMMNNNL